ncbi:MAG TPA: hypothetical protein VMU54_17795 [Planctomycetota bacterium]|nr:hypothetical protein [Planctomycetota bacterium]
MNRTVLPAALPSLRGCGLTDDVPPRAPEGHDASRFRRSLCFERMPDE